MRVLIVLLFVDVLFAITLAILFVGISKKVDVKVNEFSSKELNLKIPELNLKIPKRNYIMDFVVAFFCGLIPVFNIIACISLWFADNEVINSLAYRTAIRYIQEERQRLKNLQEFIEKTEREVNERNNKK